MEGGRGVIPWEKISKIEANCKHFRALGAISVYGNYNERLFDSAKNQEDATIGDKHYPPPGKNSKIEANCKHSQAFGAISVYMDF